MRLLGITDLSQTHPGLINTGDIDHLVPSPGGTGGEEEEDERGGRRAGTGTGGRRGAGANEQRGKRAGKRRTKL